MSRAALALLALAPALAGCLASPGPGALDAAGAGAALPALPGDLAMEGAEVLARGAGEVTFRWAGEVAPPLAPLPASASVGPDLYAETTFDVPAGAPVLLDARIGAPDAALALTLRDADGLAQCSAASDADGARCIVLLLEPQAGRAAWTAEVEGTDDLAGGSPFEVLLTLRAVDAAALLRPALQDLPAGMPPALRFLPPVQVAPDEPMHEPSLAVTPGGTVWVAGYVDRPGVLWRSTDGGASFHEVRTTDLPYCNVDDALLAAEASLPDPGPAASHVGCGDVDVAVAGEEHVYWTHHWSGEGVHASHDGGATWVPQLLASNEVLRADRQWLAVDQGDPMRAWLVLNSGKRMVTGPTGLGPAVVARTLDGGLTWIQVGQLLTSSCIPGGIVHDPGRDALYVGSCGPEGPAVLISLDGGVTWERRLVAARSGEPVHGFCFACAIFTAIAADEAGNVYAAWADPSGGAGLDVWLAASTDGARTFQEPVKVNGAAGTHLLPWVAAGAPGEVAVAWYGTTYQGDPGQATGAWYAHAARTRDALAAAPAFDEALVSGDPVRYGPVCIRGGGCGGGRNLGDLLEAALDADGRLHVAFTDGTAGGPWNGASRVLYAREEAWTRPAAGDDAATVGPGPRRSAA